MRDILLASKHSLVRCETDWGLELGVWVNFARDIILENGEKFHSSQPPPKTRLDFTRVGF